MGLEFLKEYGGSRLGDYPPQSPLSEMDEAERNEKVNLEYETEGEPWTPKSLNISDDWRPQEWVERPVRFVDGKNVGQTIATLRAPGGYIIPIRLAQVGGVTMQIVDGQCRREFETVERVVSMIIDAFPWNEVESFALARSDRTPASCPSPSPPPARPPPWSTPASTSIPAGRPSPPSAWPTWT